MLLLNCAFLEYSLIIIPLLSLEMRLRQSLENIIFSQLVESHFE